MHLAKNIMLIIATLVGAYCLTVYAVNVFAYLDPPDLCYIGITGDILGGNEETIRSALRLLKSGDPEAYHTTCRYVDRIIEMRCQGADPRGGESEENEVGWDNPGCYVRGSKTIQLKPESGASGAIIEFRAATIKKYAEYSQNFWENEE
jgi:hypothetical protein